MSIASNHPAIIPGPAPVAAPVVAPIQETISWDEHVENMLVGVISAVNSNILDNDGIFEIIDYASMPFSKQDIVSWWEGYKQSLIAKTVSAQEVIEAKKAAILSKLSPEERAILNI